MPTNISKSKHPMTTHEIIEVKVTPINVHGFPWTPDDLSNHLTTVAIAAAVSSTFNLLLDDNTASTVATSMTEDNIKESI